MIERMRSETGDPEAVARLAEEAVRLWREKGQHTYEDGNAFLKALVTANHFSFSMTDKRAGLPAIGATSNLMRESPKLSVRWDYLDAVLATNALNLPTDASDLDAGRKPRVSKEVRDFFYDLCGCFERTPENIRSKIDEVFEQHKKYPIFADFLKALGHANGMQAINNPDHISSAILQDRMGADYRIGLVLTDISSGSPPREQFINDIVAANALRFRTDEKNGFLIGNGQRIDTGQIDIFYEKAGLMHWRAETIARRRDEVMEAIEKGEGRITGIKAPVKITTAGEAFNLLFECLSYSEIERRMAALNPEKLGTPSRERISNLLNARTPVHALEFEALSDIAVKDENLQLTEDHRKLLGTLSLGMKKEHHAEFAAAMQMLGFLCLPGRHNQPEETSWRDLVHYSKQAGSRGLAGSTIAHMQLGHNLPAFQTARELVRAFERAYEAKHSVSAENIRPQLDTLLQLAHPNFTYERLFSTPEKIVFANRKQYFIDEPGNALRLASPKALAGFGKLIIDLRTAQEVDLGIADFAERSGISKVTLAKYEVLQSVPDPHDTESNVCEKLLRAANLEKDSPAYAAALQMISAYHQA